MLLPILGWTRNILVTFIARHCRYSSLEKNDVLLNNQSHKTLAWIFTYLGLLLTLPGWTAQVPVVTMTNFTLRVMAANLSSGTLQKYEAPGIRILQGLKPDIVAINEFNYSNKTTADFRSMVDTTFGTNFSYYRETGSYSIPNGVISRYPIVESGTWDDADVNINDRGFAWAHIDLPGTNDLYVVSVHLKASSGTANSTRRANQATQIKSLIVSNFPANAFIIVGGDFNTYSQTETCLTTFRSYLSDTPYPKDANNNENTSSARDNPYDRVFHSDSLGSNRVAVKIGGSTYPNGLVFDSRVYAPLAEVSPAQSGDSGVSGMQHMGVVRDYQISYPATNWMDVPAPLLSVSTNNLVIWSGPSNLTYTILTSTTLTNWSSNGIVSAASTNYSFTLPIQTNRQSFYRVVYP